MTRVRSDRGSTGSVTVTRFRPTLEILGSLYTQQDLGNNVSKVLETYPKLK